MWIKHPLGKIAIYFPEPKTLTKVEPKNVADAVKPEKKEKSSITKSKKK